MTFNPNSNNDNQPSPTPPSTSAIVIENSNSANCQQSNSPPNSNHNHNNCNEPIMPPAKVSTTENLESSRHQTNISSIQQITAKLQKINISEIEGIRVGICKWFNVAKGWGFITPNDGGQEVFVHQSVIQMAGFRSLGEQECLEFECKLTERGLEATRVSGVNSKDCIGSTYRPRPKKRYRRVRCYNCGQFANHIASKCALGPQPKRCHNCKSEDHLVADCPIVNQT